MLSGAIVQMSLPIPMLAMTIDPTKWGRAKTPARHAKRSSLPKLCSRTARNTRIKTANNASAPGAALTSINTWLWSRTGRSHIESVRFVATALVRPYSFLSTTAAVGRTKPFSHCTRLRYATLKYCSIRSIAASAVVFAEGPRQLRASVA